MIKNKKIICVIPARLASSRFPEKVLAPLVGKPLLQWTWESAMKVSFLDEVVFAIDSLKTAEVIEEFGGKYYMTSPECPVGTDRLVELQKREVLKGDIWLNWQADEPFITEEILGDLFQDCFKEEADVWTLKTELKDPRRIEDPNFPKVVCDKKGKALYFSRCPIPYHRSPKESDRKYYKHIGLYAYSDEALRKISCMKPCPLEEAEGLEQLRFLFYGLKIQVNETKKETIEINLPEHLVLAEEYVKNSHLKLSLA
jgi:3-deoxy-manno-octulosonate cytidylyltransferase (CMP-KDO synthetase)